MDSSTNEPEPIREIDPHDAASCELCPGCADRLYRIETALDRLRPLIEVLEGFAPILAASAPGPDGKRPSSLKLAMAASRLAKG